MTTQSPTLASQATAELPKLPERAPRLHRLKTDPEVYQAVLAGHKTFEIRLNDRDFRIGDELLLMETTFTGEAIRAGAPLQFTGNEMRKRVSHVLSGYGLMPGWVCLSFDCYEAGRASRAQSEWISVEDERKPVGRKPILVAVQWMNHYEHEDGTPARQEGYDVTEGEYVPQHGDRGGYFDSYAGPYDHDGWGITHWQPLPPAPATLGETK